MHTAKKQKTTGKHIGFGKVILFGEHFVVHGAPAIVAGISEYTDCTLKLTPGEPGWKVIDNRPAVPGYIVSKEEEQKIAHSLVIKHLKIDLSKDGIEITLGGPLIPSSGIGASASDVVALSRALSELYDLKLDNHQINESAFNGEKGYHGTPSGIDNTAATFGGLLSYRRVNGKSLFSSIPTANSIYLIVISTGITASTADVVADVRKLKEQQPEMFNTVMKEYNVIVKNAERAIQHGDVFALGKQMNQNHELLKKLTVSCPEIEAVVTRCRELGVLGAKLSGTGRGGIVVTLCLSKEQQESVAEGLSATCPEAKFVWCYTVDSKSASKL